MAKATLLEQYVAAHVAAGWTEVVPSPSKKHRTFSHPNYGTNLHFLGASGGFRVGPFITSSRGVTSEYAEGFLKRHLPTDFVPGPSFHERVIALLTKVHDEHIDLFLSEDDYYRWIGRIMTGAKAGQYRDEQTLREMDPTGDLLRFAKLK